MRRIKKLPKTLKPRTLQEIEITNVNRNLGTIQTKLRVAAKNSELTEEDMTGRFGKAWTQLMNGTVRMRKLVRIVNSMGYRIVLEKTGESS